jgi:hypothetical protein
MTSLRSQERKIRSAIKAYLDDPSSIDLTTDLAVLARAFDALPVYADIGRALLVRVDGSVMSVHTNQVWDDAAEWEKVDDPSWLRIAYEAGAERHPIARDILQSLANSTQG